MAIDYSLLDEYVPAVKKHMESRPYQIVATERAWGRKRHVVDGKPGSGKTLIIWTSTLLQRPKRVLILCSKNALYTWKKELRKWFPAFEPYYVINNGQPHVREGVWGSRNYNFYACTYAVAQRDLKFILQHDWDVLIMDEYQKGGLLKWKGKGRDKTTGKSKMTIGYQTIDALKHIPSIYPTSGTTTKKGPQHLWPILSILDNKTFNSYWSFVHRFCITVNGPFGKEIAGPQNTEALKETIHPYYHRIPRKETDKYLPKINRQIVPIDMTPEQAKWYKQVDDEMWYELEDGSIKTTSTTLAKVTKLRQILVCPQILGSHVSDMGAGIDIIVDMIKERDNHHCVIFTPFRPAVPIFKEYLKSALHTLDVFHIWGGTEPEELRALELKWKQTGGVMICTTLFSQSYELDTTDTCFFLGYECDHTDNEQCEGRLRRTSADLSKPINAYYLQHRNTYDERWLELLVDKKQSVKITFQSMEEAKQLLKEYRHG